MLVVQRTGSGKRAVYFVATRLLRGAVPGPVLLVDDVVDSRWTLTVVTAALVDAGSGPVFPFALTLTVST